MYVWRLPLFAFAAILATATVLTALIVVTWLRSKTSNVIGRGMLSSCVLGALLLGPGVVQLITDQHLAVAARNGMFIDPSPAVFFGPALGALALFVFSLVLFPARGPSDMTARYRIAFFTVILSLILLNSANWCAPGWCESFGFPMRYSWWSDAIWVVNGENLTAGFSSFALVVNAAIAVGTSWLLALRYRQMIKSQS